MITVGDLFLCFELTLHMCSRKVCKGNFHCKSKAYFFQTKWNLTVRFRASVDAFFNFLIKKLRNSLKKREKFSKCL